MKNKKTKKNIFIVVILFILIFWFLPTIIINLKIKNHINVKEIYSLTDVIEEFTTKNFESTYNINFNEVFYEKIYVVFNVIICIYYSNFC